MLSEIFNFLSNSQNWGFVLLIIVGAVFLLYGFFIFYHFIRFGVGGKTKVLALVFFIGACFFSAVVFTAFQKVDWPALFQTIKNSLPDIKPY